MFGLFNKPNRTVRRPAAFNLRALWNSLWGNNQEGSTRFYDGARDDDVNRSDHFAYSSYTDAYNDPVARRTLSARAHYEAANNGTLSGAADTFAAEVVGVGPNAQIVKSDDWDMISDELAREMEVKFADWMVAAELAESAYVGKRCEMIRGESFGFFYPIKLEASQQNFASPVKLGFRVVEPGRLDDHDYSPIDDKYIDGIRYDAYQRPIEYRLRTELPAAVNDRESLLFEKPEYTYIPAKYAVHSFKRELPEQRRGISRFASVLDLAYLGRQFIKSVTIAARNSARLFGFVQTQNDPTPQTEMIDGEECDVYCAPDAGEKFPVYDDEFRFLPEGYSIEMTKPAQPMSTAGEFLKAITNHLGRAIGMPNNVISKTSENSNYSSGRLDYQQWDRDVEIERERDRRKLWNLAWKLWFEEATKLEGYFTSDPAAVAEMLSRAESFGGCPRVAFRFSHRGFIDPRKEVSAATERMRNGTSSLSDEIATVGKDAETVMKRMAEDLGIDIDDHRKNVANWLYGKNATTVAGDPDQVREVVENALAEAAEEKRNY